MKKLLLANLFLVFLLASNPLPVSDIAASPEIEQDVNYRFGEVLEFHLEITGEEMPEETWLFVQPLGLGIATFRLDIDSDGSTTFLVTPSQLLLKPFSTVRYWYQLISSDGSEIFTEEAVFYYVDNRVDWQHLSDGQFDVFWQKGSREFGTSALTIAQQAWEQLASQYSSEPPTPILVYIYPTSLDLQEALALGNMTWVAGHADPLINAVLISVSPGPEQRLELQREIPHELAHIFTFASLADGYDHQPLWLLEGLASLAEMAQNAEYSQTLIEAADNNSLLSFESLCDRFPTEKAEIVLAYAQSQSFTEYLQSEYGQAQLQTLMEAYGEGLSCTAGFSRTYGISLSHAQGDWQRAVFGTNAIRMGWLALQPYLLLLLLFGGAPLLVTILHRNLGKGKQDGE